MAERQPEDRGPLPVATYRLQLTPEQRLDDVAGLVPYLAGLGISHLYLSPVFEAVPGSSHGYDGTDPTHVRAELGGREALGRLRDVCDAHGLGILLDVVPNHLAADGHGPWWWALLRDGRSGEAGSTFDVFWEGGDHRPPDTVLLPVLGRPLDEVLAAGELVPGEGPHGPELRYFEHRFPLAAGSPEASAHDPAGMLVLLQHQAYRLVPWNVASDEVGYRRFFDITGLVGLRVEEQPVFERALGLAIDLVREGTVQGLRLDHVDGLADPAALLTRLAERTDGVWTVVEKILVGDEQLRPSWAVDGTTGYEAGALIAHVLADPDGADRLLRLHGELTGERRSWAEVVDEAKAEVLDRLFRPEHDLVTRLLVEALADPALDEEELRAAVGALVVSFDEYRAYPERTGPVGIEDAFVLRAAADRARTTLPALAVLIDRVEELLLAGEGGPAGSEARTRLAQLTGPVMAKGVEDTALYRWVAVLGAGDVGSEPWPVGCSLDRFHQRAAGMTRWPRSLVATSTHDAKRSEDVRARLALLPEVADEWAEVVAALEPAVTDDPLGHRAPADLADPAVDVDGTTRLLLWQTLVGAWPIAEERVQGYLQKAVREAKRRTSWTDPDEAYEAAVAALVASAYADDRRRGHIEALVQRLDEPGRINALAQLLLKLTLPGVPDVYQGNEVWRRDLTDPDDRRPVGWDRRRLLLRTAEQVSVEEVWPEQVRGLPKLWLLRHALQVRREHAAAFAGGYEPVLATGPAADHVVAFHRGDGTAGVVVVVPRFPLRLERDGGWRGTEVVLPVGAWHDVLAGRPTWQGDVPVAELLGSFPVALLVRSA